MSHIPQNPGCALGHAKAMLEQPSRRWRLGMSTALCLASLGQLLACPQAQLHDSTFIVLAGLVLSHNSPFLPRRKSQLWKKGQVLITFRNSFCGRPACGMYLERGYGFPLMLFPSGVHFRGNKLKREEHLGTFPGALCDRPGFVLADQDSGMSQGGSTHC